MQNTGLNFHSRDRVKDDAPQKDCGYDKPCGPAPGPGYRWEAGYKGYANGLCPNEPGPFCAGKPGVKGMGFPGRPGRWVKD